MGADILVVYKKNFEEVHDLSIASLKGDLDGLNEERGTSYELVPRESVKRSDFVGRDLVIVVGGDGTLTSIAHNVDADTQILGVNSHPMEDDPNGSFGFFMGSDSTTFAKDLRAALDGEAIVNLLPRLSAEIVTTSGNRITCDPALNDLLIANTHQYQPSRYRLKREADDTHDKVDLMQRSSGVLFSTFVGQGAWFRHICVIEGMKFDPEMIHDHYLYCARDLPRDERREDGSYFAWTNKPTVINSDMHRGFCVPDGWDEWHFTRGSTVTVSIDGPKLQLLTFREKLVDKLAHWIE
jgi:hypothetical protein|tara:strand:+ start:121 stop:1008 length:888 start_codon:yes stop_codon:yes gene_type:complete